MVQVVLCEHGCMKQNDKKEMQFCLIFSVIWHTCGKFVIGLIYRLSSCMMSFS